MVFALGTGDEEHAEAVEFTKEKAGGVIRNKGTLRGFDKVSNQH